MHQIDENGIVVNNGDSSSAWIAIEPVACVQQCPLPCFSARMAHYSQPTGNFKIWTDVTLPEAQAYS